MLIVLRRHHLTLIRSLVRRCVCSLLLATIVVAALQGNILARHLGMVDATGTAHRAQVLAVPDLHAASSTAVEAEAVADTPADSRSTGGGHDGQHVLHQLGACLAVLTLLALAVQRIGAGRRRTLRSDATFVVPSVPPATPRVGPRALSPPKLSPVCRT